MTEPFKPLSGAGRRLLIVDDDEAVLGSLSEYFERLGYEVVRAPTGRQGIAGFQQQKPDVVVLDLKLPDVDGLQVLEAIRPAGAMVVLLTGYGDIPTAVRAMQLGAENFLTKPVDLPHLVAVVERAIEKADLRRENRRLRELVPTTRRRLIRLGATAALLVVAVLVGKALGGAGSSTREIPPAAPVRPRQPSPAERQIDSMLREPPPAPLGDTAKPVP